MIETNFPEAQLQQLISMALSDHFHAECGFRIPPIIVSLNDEFDVGWDSAFNLPWKKKYESEKHHGCNFFLQYKISNVLTSSGAMQWDDWGKEYFRFKIPHSKKHTQGGYFDSYHQWDRLKELADENFPVYYATNSTTESSVLLSRFTNGTLLDETPFLDVRDMAAGHKYVTFTSGSGFFYLHSERVQVDKTEIKKAMSEYFGTEPTDMNRASDALIRFLGKSEKTEESWTSDLKAIQRFRNNNETGNVHATITQMLLTRLFQKHLGIRMHWVPSIE